MEQAEAGNGDTRTGKPQADKTSKTMVGGVSFLALPLPRPEGRYRNSKLDMGV